MEGALKDRLELEKRFHAEMRALNEKWEECGLHRASRFLQGIDRHGGLDYAKRLLTKPEGYGFVRLSKIGRLDLSMEALVLKPEWQVLFSEQERATARRRLRANTRVFTKEEVSAAKRRHVYEPPR